MVIGIHNTSFRKYVLTATSTLIYIDCIIYFFLLFVNVMLACILHLNLPLDTQEQNQYIYSIKA